ncbi:MAG: hypothetical protein ACRELV_09445 [Longimicrobiales bacterium]
MRSDTVVFWRASWETPPDSLRVVPSATEWRAFWAATEEAGVRHWRRRYVSEGIVDGGGWDLELVAGGASIVSSGSNAYPDQFGREHGPEGTDAFETFRAAMNALVGR